MTAQAAALVPELLERVANGAFLRDLAKETGIDKRRLSEELRKHPDYQSAKQACIETQLDQAQEAIEKATDPADIARAREQFKAAAWRAERECPGRWGVRPELQAAQLIVNIVQFGNGERIVEAVPALLADGSHIPR